MLTQNMTEFAATIKAHAAADLIEQGEYYDEKTGRGCFIGCLAHGNDIGLIATKYGLPMPLTRLLEHVFERLDADNARAFFRDIPGAIGGDGRDLSRVHWSFLADTLRHMPPQPANVQAVIDPVIAGMDRLARGEDWPEAAEAAARAEAAACAWAWAEAAAEAWAEAAARAEAAACAEAAAWAWAWAAAAARAAEAAARAAEAAARAAEAWADEIIRQRDALLRLIKDA